MDLAEVVEDLICTFDGTSDTTMDTLAMFVFGWTLFALFALWLGRLVYDKLRRRGAAAAASPKPPSTVEEAAKKAAQVNVAPAVRSAAPGPTPPVRKRLSRQSPAPDARSRRPRYVPAPQCTGPDNVCVLWVNDVLQWLYNDFVVVNELAGVWIEALNGYTKKAGDEQGIGVELIRILPETHPPVLSNIFAEADSKDDVTITCDCEATLAFQLKSARQKAERTETSHYRVDVNRFRARLNVFCVSEKLRANVKCDGWPEIKIALAPVGNIKNINLDESQLQEVIIEILTDAIRNAEVNLNLSQYPTCPKLIRHVPTLGQILPLHYDSMGNATGPNYTSTPDKRSMGDRRLLVKIVRAAQLGASQGCSEPYCVVEMDEPPQRNQTAVHKSGGDSPQWDEHFLFDLSPNTAELLFEIYDRSAAPRPKFLGLGIVGIEELLVTPSQRQTISLQSRPYESDPVSGTLTVEFMFIEGADVPNLGSGQQPYKIKESIRTPSPHRNKNITTTTATTTTSTFHNDVVTNGNHLGDIYRDLDRNKQSSNVDTLVIHSVQRQPSQRLVKVELNNGAWKEVDTIEVNSDEATEETKEKDHQNDTRNGDSKNSNELPNPQQPRDLSSPSSNRQDESLQNDVQNSGEFRGRSRRRRDFFGTIKRRLGKSMNRSKSVGPDNNGIGGRDDSMNRSVSADRGRNDESRLSVPGGHQRHSDETSRRSSLSEASGMSSASTRTYLNEASTLVLETIENGVKKHYLVPMSLARRSKWRKKGAKLHVFSDHTFVAKHLQGGTVCQVCGKTIARRFGKQGYECRDCLIKCHKHCHVKVNDSCPTSTIHNVELFPLPYNNFFSF